MLANLISQATNWNTNQFVSWSNAQCQPNWWSQFNKINVFSFTLIMHMFKCEVQTTLKKKSKENLQEPKCTQLRVDYTLQTHKARRVKWEITTWMLSPNILEVIKDKNWQSRCIKESTTRRTYNKNEWVAL
jgi:hypothetical protein